MPTDLGDREYGHGDSITETAGADVEAGDFVALDSNGEVALADTDNAGELIGIASNDAAAGETVTVWYRGAVKGKVVSGVGPNAELGAPATGTSGTAGVAESGGSTGVRALTGAEDPDGDGTYEALILLR